MPSRIALTWRTFSRPATAKPEGRHPVSTRPVRKGRGKSKVFCLALPRPATVVLVAATPAALLAVDPPLPAPSISVYAEAKVINEVTDSLQQPRVNYAKYETGLDKNSAVVAGESANAALSINTMGTDLQGQGSSASAEVNATAMAGFGTFHALGTGSATVERGSSQGWATATAVAEDYFRLTGTTGSEIQLQVGNALSATVTAGGEAYAGIGVNLVVSELATGRVLWQNTLSHDGSTVPDSRQVASQLLTVRPGTVLRMAWSMNAQGSVSPSTTEGTLSASFLGDASHTAELLLKVLTANATYESASGTVYRTAPSWEDPGGDPKTCVLGMARSNLETPSALTIFIDGPKDSAVRIFSSPTLSPDPLGYTNLVATIPAGKTNVVIAADPGGPSGFLVAH